VQRRFTKRIPGMRNLSYYQRLRALGTESLELRRLRADLLFTYKLVFGPLDVNVSEFFITQFSNKRRGHRYKLYVSTCKSSVRCNCFSHRVIRVWNILPDCVNFTTYNDFKHSPYGPFVKQNLSCLVDATTCTDVICRRLCYRFHACLCDHSEAAGGSWWHAQTLLRIIEAHRPHYRTIAKTTTPSCSK